MLIETSALTLEFLETAFYEQGFAHFSAFDFKAIGLSTDDITNLISIGQTEQVHVTSLLTAIAGTGTKPVAPCTYKFGFTDAASMVATASILENVGVSAYVPLSLAKCHKLTNPQLPRRRTPYQNPLNTQCRCPNRDGRIPPSNIHPHRLKSSRRPLRLRHAPRDPLNFHHRRRLYRFLSRRLEPRYYALLCYYPRWECQREGCCWHSIVVKYVSDWWIVLCFHKWWNSGRNGVHSFC